MVVIWLWFCVCLQMDVQRDTDIKEVKTTTFTGLLLVLVVTNKKKGILNILCRNIPVVVPDFIHKNYLLLPGTALPKCSFCV